MDNEFIICCCLLNIFDLFRDEKKDQEDVSNLLESIARANKDTSLPSSSASDTSNDYHANSSKNDDSIYKKWSYVTKQELEVYGANLRCSYCFFDFNTRHRYRFLDHEESHRQGKFIVCKYCGMLFFVSVTIFWD